MLKYLLIIMLATALVRFLNNMARLGQEGRKPLRPDTEEADYEILPDDPDPPSD